MMTILMLSALSAGAFAPDLPLLSPMFGDHMVLQRDRPNTFWGWAAPGTRVKVTVAKNSGSGVAGPDGRWTAKVKPPKVGGPYSVIVEGPKRIELKDVLVGDVWICSGQSNMEFGLSNVFDGPAEVAAADHPNLRLFMVGRQVGYAPIATAAGQWKICSPTTVAQDGWGGFSAVGYFFGRKLQQELKVPIGLVESSWGGTSAEAWTSERALRPLKDFDGDLDKVDAARGTGGPVFGTYVDRWMAEHDAGDPAQGGWHKEDLDESGWVPTTVPDGFSGAGLAEKDGAIWLRKTIDLPNPLPAGAATLYLGRIDEVDTTYVNGHLLGTTRFDWAWRKYGVADGLLKPGRNVIAVRVFDTSGRGGFLGAAEDLYLEIGGTRIPLAGNWKAKLGFDKSTATDQPRNGEPNPTIPGVLFNGMIAPVAPLSIRGAIWYQGETNAGRGAQYQRLLPALIGDWRKHFDQGDLPFYVVSLANFMARREQPGDDWWAELREAQALTSQRVANSGLAVTIDIGDANDVHPRDKKTVGERLAANALRLEYGKKVAHSGPVYRAMHVEGDSVRLKFAHAEGGFVVKGDRLGEFSVAGADHVWHWADARIDGETIVVRSPEVEKPLAVRYAWQSNPRATLYNAAGFPAVPFRTDDWPLLSANSK